MINKDKELFIGTDGTFFENGKTRSNDVAYKGKYSTKLNAKSPYGMTIKLNDLKNGESIIISVWRKSKLELFILWLGTFF